MRLTLTSFILYSYTKYSFCLILICLVACSGSAEESDYGTGTGESEAGDSVEISLSHLDSMYLDPGDHLIGRFRERLHVHDEVLLFVENSNQQVWAFDHAGTLKYIIGGRGRGPEEFMNISGVFVDDKERVVITDETQNMVKVFDIDGQFLKSFSLFDHEELFISSRDIHVHDDILYLQIAEAEHLDDLQRSRLIARYDLSGEFIDFIGWYDPSIADSFHYLSGHNFAVDHENDLLISNLETTYLLQIHSTKDSTVYEYFGEIPPFWKAPEEEIDPFWSRQQIMDKTVGNSYSKGIFVTNDYILVHSQKTSEEWYETSDYMEKPNFLTVYDRESKAYVGSISIPGVLTFLHDDVLYMIEDFHPDQFQIGMYQLNVN